MTKEQAVKARDLLDLIRIQEKKIKEIRKAYNESALLNTKVWVDFGVKNNAGLQCVFTDNDNMIDFRNKLYELLICNEQNKLNKLEEELEKL